jgi:uncharacterized protein YdeI (YjbR/CyaY-like superfamily)
MPERAMITDPEEFFTKGCGRCDRFAMSECSTRWWLAGLEDLRRICLDAGLIETAKWGHPCYMHAGRNIAVVGAFRGDFRLNFVHAALLQDPEGVLETQGPNSARPSMLRFTDNAQVRALEPVIRAYLKEAMGYAEACIVPTKEAVEIELPDELVEALDADPELAEAFHALTPGRQKSYIFAINGAKQSATRVARITKFRERILAGKGALER